MARALWKGAISFGLVTIPVALYPAKSSTGDITFHMLHKDDLARVRREQRADRADCDQRQQREAAELRAQRDDPAEARHPAHSLTLGSARA